MHSRYIPCTHTWRRSSLMCLPHAINTHNHKSYTVFMYNVVHCSHTRTLHNSYGVPTLDVQQLYCSHTWCGAAIIFPYNSYYGWIPCKMRTHQTVPTQSTASILFPHMMHRHYTVPLRDTDPLSRSHTWRRVATCVRCSYSRRTTALLTPQRTPQSLYRPPRWRYRVPSLTLIRLGQ